LFISVLFGYLVTRHLATMAAYARRLEFGGRAESLELDRVKSAPSKQDELDGLVAAINEMQDNLRQTHLELQKSHDELEDRVIERTKELTHRKKNGRLAFTFLDRDVRGRSRNDVCDQYSSNSVSKAAV